MRVLELFVLFMLAGCSRAFTKTPLNRRWEAKKEGSDVPAPGGGGHSGAGQDDGVVSVRLSSEEFRTADRQPSAARGSGQHRRSEEARSFLLTNTKTMTRLKQVKKEVGADPSSAGGKASDGGVVSVQLSSEEFRAAPMNGALSSAGQRRQEAASALLFTSTATNKANRPA